MAPQPDPGTPEASAAEDRASVLEMMGSPQMQRRLEEARAQRERVLAEKAAKHGPAAQDPKVRLAWDRELGSIGVVGAVTPDPGEEAPALPWTVEPPEPVPARAGAQPVTRRAWPRSRAAGIALGLVAGVVLGIGLMRLAEPAPSGLPNAPATTSAASRDGTAVVVASPARSALAVGPSLASAGVGPPSDLPPLQVPAAGPSGGDAPVRVAEAGAVESGTVDATSAAPVEVASELLAVLPSPDAEAGVEAAVAGLAAAVRPGPVPVLAAPPSPDAPPPAQGAPDGPSGGLLGLDWTVALHLPPDTSPEALQEAQAVLRAVGVGLVVGTGASPFGVAQSEVRFFHGDDASDAARIAQAMGVQARDFSAYRPAPPPGSFEVWLADDPGARLAD